jgi:two-component system OmpR family sensor kinase
MTAERPDGGTAARAGVAAPRRLPLGRLFWKFFLWVGAIQMASTLGIGFWIAYDHHRFDQRPPPPPYGAPHPGGADGEAPRSAPDRPPPDGPHGTPRRGGPDGPAPGEARHIIPLEPFIGGVLASLGCAALLAWYLSKPIRTLRGAFAAAEAGELDVRIAGSMGGGSDEIKDLGRDFDRMVARLQLLIQSQRQLLHDVSHEMRSPLARIQAAIGLAGQQPEQMRAAMERIERESVRMDRLVGELLALARLEARAAGDAEEFVDLHELLSAIVDDARFEAQARGRRLQATLAAGPMVRGNAELLRRAVENVVRNAIKFSPEGGSIEVDLRFAPGARAALLTIEDGGPGVPEAELESIFQPFFRSSRTAAAQGNGLGLAIARRVVERHGGRIAASNRAPGGLCVRLELPLAAGVPAAPA